MLTWGFIFFYAYFTLCLFINRAIIYLWPDSFIGRGITSIS